MTLVCLSREGELLVTNDLVVEYASGLIVYAQFFKTLTQALEAEGFECLGEL